MVTLVYRSPRLGAVDRIVHQFPERTVFDWFVAHWDEMKGDPEDEMCVPGTDLPGFWVIPDDQPPPRDLDELLALLDNGIFELEEHCLQMIDSRGDIDAVHYLFDSDYLSHSGDQAAWLLHESWVLPPEITKRAEFTPSVEVTTIDAGDGEGSVWLQSTALYMHDGGLIGDRPIAIEGLRLPDLPRWLASTTPDDDWPFALLLLRALLLLPPKGASARERSLIAVIEADPASPGPWAVYGDWLAEQGEEAVHIVVLRRVFAEMSCLSVRDLFDCAPDEPFYGSFAVAHAEIEAQRALYGVEPGRSEIATSTHTAQLCQEATLSGESAFEHWFLFDDVWASAHPELAQGVMCYVSSWWCLHSNS